MYSSCILWKKGTSLDTLLFAMATSMTSYSGRYSQILCETGNRELTLLAKAVAKGQRSTARPRLLLDVLGMESRPFISKARIAACRSAGSGSSPAGSALLRHHVGPGHIWDGQTWRDGTGAAT
jgi:hypothetical protein